MQDTDPNGRSPSGSRFELELRAAGVRPGPVPVLDEAGRPLPALLEVLEVVAHHGIVLATGHLSQVEIVAVVDAAVDAGVETIVVTHPEFPSQSIPPAVQRELADRGALMERAFTTPYTGKCTWEAVFEATRAVGAAAPCGDRISARCSTRRWRTGWRSWPTASSRPGSARRRSG